MNRTRATLVIAIALVGLVGLAGSIHGLAPQTIAVDGSNDFLAENLLDADGYDCELVPIDIDSVFVTNDVNKLYIGFQYDKDGWTGNQVGIAISTGGAGGTTDPWGHAIAWNTAPHKPDYHCYCNMDNSWQELRTWNVSSWDLLYSGTSSLGWVNNTGFEELGLNLSDLGISAGDTIYIEIISTQDGSSKGPLDAVANDDLQLSTPGGTTWDAGSPVELDSMIMYIVQAAGDSEPPTISRAGLAVAEPGAGGDALDVIRVDWSEPVDEATAENASNWSLVNTTASIDSVVRDGVFPSRVRLYLDAPIAPDADYFGVKAVDVEDLNGNVVVDNDTTNVACFFVKGLLFRGRMGFHLGQTSFGVDTFTVEGGIAPLTWTLCDNAFMSDTGGGVYELLAYFSLDGECVYPSPGPMKTLEWKFVHQCSIYESIPNRIYIVNDESAYDTIDVYWDDYNEADYTDKAIDVVFTVDLNTYDPGLDSVVAINGSVAPLTFDVPSVNGMADDGVAPDASAGDGIYALAVRFPALSFKTVNYKYLYNDVYECIGEDDREVWLNDAAYDTVGGTLGPIVMPLQYYDRCSTIGRDVEVVFTVDTRWVKPGAGDTVAVNGGPGNTAPPVIDWSVPSINPMADDGVAPDAAAGDGIYSLSIVFPDSHAKYVEYKYLFNSAYECTTQANRYVFVDDAFDAVGNPQLLELDYFNTCVVSVDDQPQAPFVLRQNFPNPFNPTTTILFVAPERGRAMLRVYDVNGRLVRTLLDGVVEAGEVRVAWDGTDAGGNALASGVYFCKLLVGDRAASRKMILLR
ncbi:MAG: T9SS type A sorting domain-containing protein [Candidatus Krumholzibacteriota bacterium]|nr:T9SS type A sorting domain-containing protein [Candidatus Krumholzibacteriota bacterium]